MDIPGPSKDVLESIRQRADESAELLLNDAIERHVARLVRFQTMIRDCTPEQFEWLKDAALTITDDFVKHLHAARYSQLATHQLVKSVRDLAEAMHDPEESPAS